jgi:dolichol-phosphate mannosyltransferase
MPELAVIVPTYNERENVSPLIKALERPLAGIDFEIIFIDDDSPDGTVAAVRSLSQADPRFRIVQPINRRGLASAVVEGMMAKSVCGRGHCAAHTIGTPSADVCPTKPE